MKDSIQIPFDLGFENTMSRDNFLESGCNVDALTIIEKWPEWNDFALVLYGDVASGKTHLLNIWHDISDALVISDEMMQSDNIIEILGGKMTVAIDNVDKYYCDKTAENNLFHIYNYIKETGGYLLLTSEKPPGQSLINLPDLSSRLLAIPVVQIGLPSDEMLSALLVKLFDDRQLLINNDVVRYVVARIPRSMGSVLKLVYDADKKSLAEKRNITIPLIKEIINL